MAKTHFLSWNIYFVNLKKELSSKILFSDELKDFLYSLITRFSADVNQLFLEREQRRLELRRTGTLPDFSSSVITEDKTWRISPLPERLLCRNIDLGNKIWLKFPWRKWILLARNCEPCIYAKLCSTEFRLETELAYVQGVPRNITVGKYFKMSSSIIFRLFDTKENNNKHYMAVFL